LIAQPKIIKLTPTNAEEKCDIHRCFSGKNDLVNPWSMVAKKSDN